MHRQVQNIQSQQQRMDNQQDQMDRRLQKLAESSTAADARAVDVDKNKDRRRLKERLKKAAHAKSEGQHVVSWMEYIFGIRPGDERMGMQGSRC
jgi:hypothetical protein